MAVDEPSGTFTLLLWPVLRFTVRAVYDHNGQDVARGTVSVTGVGVIGTMRVPLSKLRRDDIWQAA
jgi:hypothetical protein